MALSPKRDRRMEIRHPATREKHIPAFGSSAGTRSFVPLVIAGLDPAIHPLRKIFLNFDGWPGQAKSSPAMTVEHTGERRGVSVATISSISARASAPPN
jgi:hypothetical protein